MEKEKATWGGKRREGRTQTPMTIRVDNDLVEMLADTPNKGRFINEAIREKLTPKKG